MLYYSPETLRQILERFGKYKWEPEPRHDAIFQFHKVTRDITNECVIEDIKPEELSCLPKPV